MVIITIELAWLTMLLLELQVPPILSVKFLWKW